MIVQETWNEQFCRTYSDLGFAIRKIGTDEIYGEAIDLSPHYFQYEETDILALRSRDTEQEE